LMGATAALPAGLIAAGPGAQYRIQTLAGNGMAGDIPSGGGKATEISVDLPFGVENGPDGALYITTVGSHRVLRLDRQSGQVTSVAGNGRKGYSGDGGPATNATLNEPYEVRFDSHGNMLIVDMKNHAIRRVDVQTGTISTVAGDGVAGDRGDGGPARQARLRMPHSITLDEKDNLYVSDLANHRVRRIDGASGRIESIVGNGKGELPRDGGNARAEPFLTPQGLAVRGENLWIASVSGHSLWRLDLKRGTIHRVAGTGKRGHTGDGGAPLRATFDGPRGMTMSPSGILYVAEGENNIIRAVDTVHGSIRTVAGVGPTHHRYGGDGIAATRAPLWQPHGVCLSAKDSLIISDTINHRVRLLVPISGKAR
jgi:sugar lactone lactonase YvrE